MTYIHVYSMHAWLPDATELVSNSNSLNALNTLSLSSLLYSLVSSLSFSLRNKRIRKISFVRNAR